MHAHAPPEAFPPTGLDEREVLLGFLDAKRAAVLQAADGLDDAQGRWTPSGGVLLPIAGIINHLTQVETRWVDGRYLQLEPPAADPDVEFASARPLAELVDDYCVRRRRTNDIVRGAPGLDAECSGHPSQPPRRGLDLRWVLLHLLEETAQHAGHAEATRELVDGRRRTT